MEKEEKNKLVKIIISVILLMIITLFSFSENVKLVIYISTYFLIGYEIIFSAIKNMLKGKIFDENFLMTIATIGAVFLGQYNEAILVMLLYQVGELFQSLASEKSKKSIEDLINLKQNYVNVERDGKIVQKDPREIRINEHIIVKVGEKIPLDGIVIKGTSLIDTANLTGESIPKNVSKTDTVLSGCINKTGVLTIKVTKEYESSTATKILKLIEQADNNKAPTEKFITKFSRYYTPVVVFLALSLAFIPPIFINELKMIDCIKRALAFLVVSCPCALVISVPLAFFAGIGAISRHGVLIKGSNYLELLSKIKTIVFDKTGTLTEGSFKVQKVIADDFELLIDTITSVEEYSNHPISLALKKYQNKVKNKKRVEDLKELAGRGIIAKLEGKQVLIGNEKLMKEYNICCPTKENYETITYVVLDNKLIGTIIFSDSLKENIKSSIKYLKEKNKIEKIIMLTGDKKDIAKNIANELNLDGYYAELLPEDKVAKIKEIKSKDSSKKIAFVGDGINDILVLLEADLGIAMGVLGSDAAIEAADIIVMDDDISKINDAIYLSKKTINIVKQNIYFSIGIKFLVLILSTFGLTNMIIAILADVGVSIIAILNSIRILKIKSSH